MDNIKIEAPERDPIRLESQCIPQSPPTPCSLPLLGPQTPCLMTKPSPSSSPLSPPPLLTPSPLWGSPNSSHTLSLFDPLSPPQLPDSITTPLHLSPRSSSLLLPPSPERTRFLQAHHPRGNDFDTNYLIARFILAIRVWVGTRSGIQVARIEFETAAIAAQVLEQQGGEGGGRNRAYSLYAERENEEHRWWEQEGITCMDVKSYWGPTKSSIFWFEDK